MAKVLDLESKIKALPGVLGCVIMTDGDGDPLEIQAFVRLGVDLAATQQAIRDAVRDAKVGSVPRQIFVFELDAESQFGDRESLQRAAELAEQEARVRGPSTLATAPGRDVRRRPGTGRGRPLVNKVVLTSSSWTSESQVALKLADEEIVGTASGDKTPHGLSVLAQATLDAAQQLTGGVDIRLEAASLVNISGREAVLVLVRNPDGLDNLGTALVRSGPIHEVAVRATLAAINRRLEQELAG